MPIHWAMGNIMLSQGYCGIRRPLPDCRVRDLLNQPTQLAPLKGNRNRFQSGLVVFKSVQKTRGLNIRKPAIGASCLHRRDFPLPGPRGTCCRCPHHGESHQPRSSCRPSRGRCPMHSEAKQNGQTSDEGKIDASSYSFGSLSTDVELPSC